MSGISKPSPWNYTPGGIFYFKGTSQVFSYLQHIWAPAGSTKPAGLTQGIILGNTGTLPTGNPGNAVAMYSDAGVFKMRNPAGNIYSVPVGQNSVKQGDVESSIDIDVAQHKVLSLADCPYGFYGVTIKAAHAGRVVFKGSAPLFGETLGTAYEYQDYHFENTSGSDTTVYLKQYYITGSGEVFWIFHMVEKESGKIICSYSSNDHPLLFGKELPDFPDFDPAKHEIIMMNPSDELIKEIRVSSNDDSVLQTVHEKFTYKKHPVPKWPGKAVCVGIGEHEEVRETPIYSENLKDFEKKPLLIRVEKTKFMSHGPIKKKIKPVRNVITADLIEKGGAF